MALPTWAQTPNKPAAPQPPVVQPSIAAEPPANVPAEPDGVWVGNIWLDKKDEWVTTTVDTGEEVVRIYQRITADSPMNRLPPMTMDEYYSLPRMPMNYQHAQEMLERMRLAKYLKTRGIELVERNWQQERESRGYHDGIRGAAAESSDELYMKGYRRGKSERRSIGESESADES